MSKLAIIYASTTGNTKAMAEAILQGAENAEIFEADSFDASTVNDYDALALGSPAMGAEELEDSVEGLFLALEPNLTGKKLSLFGSYDWGDGEWMRIWEERASNAGATVVQTLICNNAPDDEMVESCKSFGKKML